MKVVIPAGETSAALEVPLIYNLGCESMGQFSAEIVHVQAADGSTVLTDRNASVAVHLYNEGLFPLDFQPKSESVSERTRLISSFTFRI